MRISWLVLPYLALLAPGRPLAAQACQPGDSCWVQELIQQRCTAELGRSCNCTESNVELTLCARLHYEYADSILNAVYRETLAVIDESDWLAAATRAAWKRDLREAQRTWIRLKELDCGLVSEYEYAGGSHARFAELDCLRAHTEFRTRQLRERLEP